MARNTHSTVLDDDLLRLRLLLAIFLLAQVLLGIFLWRIQIAQSDQYKVDLAKQSIRRVRLPGVRGGIYDRNGEVLAENRPSYGVAIYLEELRQPGRHKNTVKRIEEVVQELSEIIGQKPDVNHKQIVSHVHRRLPLPLMAWNELSPEALARLAESGMSIPGVDIYTKPVRFYPHASLACHLLGYVGRADPPKEEEPYHYYMPEMAGRAGVEKTMDYLLRGEAGGRLLRVDVSGYRRHDVAVKQPRRGNDLMLSIDADVQAAAEQIMTNVAGSVVVLDPNTGDVIAMVSSPGYDLNSFIPGISTKEWEALNTNPDLPLINRAVAGTYPPGSTFKMVTALAALVNGTSSPSDVYNCPGYFELGKAVFHCGHRSGHGPVNLRQAIEGSCNVYFFHIGLKAGIDAIYHMATALGLGATTGIELNAEVPGLVPNPAWKRYVYNDGWRDGDTCNVSMGQGALLVTPLQMAVLTSVLANGGTLYRPRLVIGIREEDSEAYRNIEPVVVKQMGWGDEYLGPIRSGMKDVVMGAHGTGRSAGIAGINVAGKTGTAEFGRKEDRTRHAWMVAFAPYEKPQYAIALLVDEGKSGGETAGPRMKRLLEHLFDIESEGTSS